MRVVFVVFTFDFFCLIILRFDFVFRNLLFDKTFLNRGPERQCQKYDLGTIFAPHGGKNQGAWLVMYDV